MIDRTRFGRTIVLAAGLACALAVGTTVQAADGAGEAKTAEKIKVVILVGGHGYDERGFETLWNSLDGLAWEVWKGAPYTVFDDISQFKYDVIVMYNLSSGMTDTQKKNFLTLLDNEIGLVVWHHALANCQDWPEFEKIAGGKFWLAPGERNGAQVPRSGTGFGTVKMRIEDPNHPITQGMTDFEIEDEPYNGQTFCDGIRVLVTGDHPRSDKQIAWIQTYGKARVFGYQSGHDAKAWSNPSFQKLMTRGILWVAGRLAKEPAQ
jgi:hypothetical protein